MPCGCGAAGVEDDRRPAGWAFIFTSCRFINRKETTKEKLDKREDGQQMISLQMAIYNCGLVLLGIIAFSRQKIERREEHFLVVVGGLVFL